jgi:soluble lytic murein transglycosylase
MGPQHPPNRLPSSRLKRGAFWILGALLMLIALTDWWFERQKEHRFDPAIVRVSRQYGLSPGLVKGVVWRESKFNPQARGRAGEIGLMQIRSLAAQEWAAAETRKRTFEGNLFDPETNLQVGTWYLSKLVKRYGRTDNPVAYALADYNAGRSNVLRWNKGPAETNTVLFLTQITFPGTQEYVQSILERAAQYERRFR